MKRKWLAIVIILLFFGTCILPAMAHNTEKSQSSRGNWLYVGGNGPGNYSKIQDAVDNASDGDTVFVYDDSAPYYENVRVNKSITLLGENRDTTIIDANKSGSPILLIASDVTISGFTIQNSTGGNDPAGILLYMLCNNNSIIGNKIINNNFGIHLRYSSNTSIKNNIITQNKRFGILCGDSDLSKIENNIITYNIQGGIWLDFSELNKITKNYIDGHEVNIFLFKSLFNDIYLNTISNVSYIGIILSISYGNRIHSNNFINNTEDVSFEYGLSWALLGNRFIKNYWDSYLGIGPKVIVGFYFPVMLIIIMFLLFGRYPYNFYTKWLQFDWFPAQEPYDIPGMT